MVKKYLLMGVVFISTALQADPLESGFSYQGQLTDNNVPANGSYDFEVELYDAASAGSQVGVTLNIEGVDVVEGLFSIELDFGTLPYMGDQLWVLTKVRDGGSVGGFTELLPLQKLTAVPYAIHAEFVATGSVGGGEIDDSQVQRRVTGNCPAGQTMTAVNTDGSVQCVVDAGLTSVTSADIVDGTIQQVDMGADSIGAEQLDENGDYEVDGLTATGQINFNSVFDIIIRDDYNGLRWKTSDDSITMASIEVRESDILFRDNNNSRVIFESNANGIGIGTNSPTSTHTVTIPSLNVTGNLEIGYQQVLTSYSLSSTIASCHSHGNLTCYYGNGTAVCPVGTKLLGGGSSGATAVFGSLSISGPINDTTWSCAASYDIANATRTCYAICARLE